MNVLFGMIAIDVLYGTEVIFNYLSHSQAKPVVLLYISSMRLKIFHWIWKLYLN